jgi:diguanylate cyclase (GGDEF)-like protein
MARLEGEHARLTRSPSEPSTVLVFDIDHFKGINDRLGHAAGDAVLREIGARVREGLRRSDTAGRIGGEEFAMILSGTPAATAWHFAERLRRKIADAPIAIDGGAVTVTISVGLAAMNPALGSADVALRRADEAMYRAKRDGRNRVEPSEAEGQVRDQPVEG